MIDVKKIVSNKFLGQTYFMQAPFWKEVMLLLLINFFLSYKYIVSNFIKKSKNNSNCIFYNRSVVCLSKIIFSQLFCHDSLSC